MVTLRPSRTPWRICMSALLIAIFTVVGASTLAQTASSEYQVKAAFLYQFATYVEWPQSAFASDSSAIEFGVVAAPELAINLEEIARSRRIGERPIVVRRLDPEDSFAGLHVLFVGASPEPAIQQALAQVNDNPVLTVTEATGDRLAGSIINFEIIDERVRFDVFVTLADRLGLEISARLLSVAQRIVE